MSNIRNFAIIAHVDHGKSTLADRLLEITGVVAVGKHQEQLLDRNPISRERGITIKLAPVRMLYKNPKSKILNPKQIQNSNFPNLKHSDLEFRALSNSEYILNLIDTPGHVDFSYEVERTLACVEGVILLVDATQGIQAQTIAHAYKAMEQNKIIIPAVNKIDLASAQVATTKKELAEFLSCDESEIFEISAKTGQNVEKLPEAVIEKIPPPENPKSEFRALIFDSYYDSYRGVIAFIRVFDGEIKAGHKVKLHATNTAFDVLEVGIFTPELKKKDSLSEGEIGYVITNLKDIHLVRVGDTITTVFSVGSPLPGYRAVKPMVYASLFPMDPDAYPDLKKAIEKLALSDSALTYEAIYSTALGSGLRVGFLGLLHADVVRERLEREFNLSLVLTPPTVEYKKNGRDYLEPLATVMIITLQQHTGVVMRLCEESRGIFLTMDNKFHVYLSYEIPLSELMTHFYDRLKTVSSGYASLDWEFKEYRLVDVDKLIVLLNREPVEEFSEMVVAERAFERGRELTTRLRELIPRQQFEVKIQAQYKGKIIASQRIAPFRKDVTGKLYGGDRTRKDKLLERQKKGKKELKNIGRVEIPKEVFLKLFKS